MIQRAVTENYSELPENTLETNNIESNSSKKGTEARKIALQSDQDPKTSTNNAKEGKPQQDPKSRCSSKRKDD